MVGNCSASRSSRCHDGRTRGANRPFLAVPPPICRQEATAPRSNDSEGVKLTWSATKLENDRTLSRESSGVLNFIMNAGTLVAVIRFTPEGAVKRLRESDFFHPP